MKEYNDIDIDVIGVKLDCLSDLVSSIVHLFQREKFISIYVGKSIKKKEFGLYKPPDILV